MIEYVTIDQAAELDAFVLRQPNCHFMQTSAWGRVKEGWGWTGILCRDEKGEIIGSMAILEHRIRHMHTGFLYAPRGPIFRDGDYATLEALVDAMRALGAKSVVITSAVVDGTNAVIGYDHVAGEYFTIPFDLIPVYFPGTGDTFSAVLVGRVMAGWSLQHATADAMRVVAELIERNADQEDKSAGLPIEACLDVIDHE